MKKIILFVLLIINISVTAQYNQLNVPQTNSEISNSLQYWGNQMSNIGKQYRNNNERELTRKQRQEKREREVIENKYINYFKLANEEFNNKNYDSTIIYYDAAKQLGVYLSDFEMLAGISYIMIYRNNGNTENLESALSILGLAKEHGNPNAQKFIDLILNQTQ
ncbi:hypothetical protein [Kaistella montana]|uniref:Uncharacterized protein n=1 Tax=Kaistella montana TaxID=1849733 RepID=A0ABW5K9Y1_9FLAO|nr:hypothetical protein [Kaistella montana]MCQ4035067.1 hypothetical protein [Kaistella montana]